MELLVVLIVGSLIIAALTTTVISVLKGSSGLTHYADMKAQADRLLFYFEQDVAQAASLRFVTATGTDLLTFDLYDENDVWIAGYTFGEDSDPPAGLTAGATWYHVRRHPNGGTDYELADGFEAPPAVNFTGYGGNPVRSLFFFLDSGNNEFNHDTAAGRARAEDGAVKIRLNGIMRRGGEIDYSLSHEVFSLVMLKGRVAKNSSF